MKVSARGKSICHCIETGEKEAKSARNKVSVSWNQTNKNPAGRTPSGLSSQPASKPPECQKHRQRPEPYAWMKMPRNSRTRKKRRCLGYLCAPNISCYPCQSIPPTKPHLASACALLQPSIHVHAVLVFLLEAEALPATMAPKLWLAPATVGPAAALLHAGAQALRAERASHAD